MAWNIGLLVALGGAPARADMVVEPFLGYEGGSYKSKLIAPPSETASLSKSPHGVAGGLRVGMKREKGFWGIGGELNLSSLGTRGMNYIRPLDLGIYATHWWRGGFRIRASWYPYSQIKGVSGRGYRVGMGILLGENLSANLDFISRTLDLLGDNYPKSWAVGIKTNTVQLSFGLPFGEGNVYRRRGGDDY